MLRITIDLLPFGSEKNRKTLTTFDIANDGTGTPSRGNYKMRMSPKKPWIEGVVENYPRASYPVTKLLYLALKNKYA